MNLKLFQFTEIDTGYVWDGAALVAAENQTQAVDLINKSMVAKGHGATLETPCRFVGQAAENIEKPEIIYGYNGDY